MLTPFQNELEHHLSLFARDEVMTWNAIRQRPSPVDLAFRQHVSQNIDHIIKRAETMACKLEREQVDSISSPRTWRRVLMGSSHRFPLVLGMRKTELWCKL